MTYDFWTDVHIGSPIELPFQPNPKNGNEYLLGDIFDMTNCAKKDVESLRARKVALEIAYEDRYIMGNHESSTTVNEQFIIQDGSNFIKLVHGDFESWGADKAIAYRRRPWGASWFKRKVIVPLIEDYEHNFDRNFSTAFRDRLALNAIADKCNIIICGHVHPRQIIDITHMGTRLIVLPRGKTTLSF